MYNFGLDMESSRQSMAPVSMAWRLQKYCFHRILSLDWNESPRFLYNGWALGLKKRRRVFGTVDTADHRVCFHSGSWWDKHLNERTRPKD